ncbi:hypothetical protein HHI36_015264 [Cryptolaemus montrouzieri]|uniref:Ubiquitin-like protease family profile domain-containing protein n=1 Tax=Cryptolaemus montrouzieri TaxID=559131 RepID=A0ABD2N5W4_9CUCU
MSRRGIDQNVSSDTSLTFGETRVTGSDIRLLSSNGWISITLISFFFEYLNSRVFTSYKCSLCVSPEVTALLQITPAVEFDAFLEPLEVHQKDLIIFSISDNTDHDNSHWSLLVFSKWDNTIFHFDSMAGHNSQHATSLGEKIMAYFHVEYNTQLTEVECLQEKQAQDSGIHILAQAEQVITYAAKARTVTGCPTLTEKYVNDFRQKMLKLIWKLKHSSSVYKIKSKNRDPSLFSKSWHEEYDRDRF